MKVKAIKTIETNGIKTNIISEGTIYDVINGEFRKSLASILNDGETLVKIKCDDGYERYLRISNFIDLTEWRDNQINQIINQVNQNMFLTHL